ISFDVSFQEIFSTILFGGELYLIDEETRDDVSAMFRLIDKNEIKTLFLPASYLKFILGEASYAKQMPVRVRHIVSAGEQVIVNETFRNYLQKHKIKLHNHYGPSETHVVTALTIEPDGEIPELPTIGKPLTNTGIYIVDSAMNPQPRGVPGELIITGNQVGRGYLNQPELTKQKYPLNKSFCGAFFKKRPPGGPPEAKAYRTGDLAKWLPD
ncbi:MAG: AMP-binding protein, partial [bacterium]|nr:AMP-binding protein [bacterium]